MAVTILLEEAVTLLIKLEANLFNTTLIWTVAFIANESTTELVYLETLIRHLNVSLKPTVNSGMNDAKEHIHKLGNNMTSTI